jgi:hypothetical protein
VLDTQVTPPEIDASFGVIAGIAAFGLAAWHIMHANWLFAVLMAVIGISSLFHARRLLRQPPVQQDVRRFRLRSMFLLVAVIAAVLWTITYVLRN